MKDLSPYFTHSRAALTDQAAHDRKIAAEAWDQGYESAVEFTTGPDWGASPQNPYRADRIEQGGDR